MNKKDKIQIMQKIEKEITETLERIAEYKDLTKPIAPENSIGRVSRMDAINNKSVVEAALIESQNKLNDLKVAKNEISNPDFGICSKCGSSIPIGRIMIRPQSRHCVNCAN